MLVFMEKKCALYTGKYGIVCVFPSFYSGKEKPIFKKLEYHVVSHADIEIFSVENNRLTNVSLMDGCLGRHLISETK